MHTLSITTVVALLIGAAFAAVLPGTHYVHEARAALPPGWSKYSSVEGDALEKRYALDKETTMPMHIALTQTNLDAGPNWLDEISSPFSANYGRHWTMDQVRDAFAPSHESVHAVRQWLIESGFNDEHIHQSTSGGFLKFTASISQLEDLLKTEYHVYDGTDGNQYTGCDSYSLPHHLKDHVDFVMPTLHFSAPLERSLRKRDTTTYNPIIQGPVLIDFDPSQPGPCDQKITPQCLRQLYNFSTGTTSLVKNSFGIFEAGSYYNAQDLDQFLSDYSKNVPVGTRPTFDSIDGGIRKNINGANSVEANLDFQYAIALTYPQNVTLYQVGDPVEGGDFNQFLDAIDGSYCKNGGDSPLDPPYPDPSNETGSYKGPLQCGVFPPTKVISVSYELSEYASFPASYLQRQCAEYMKLGMMGSSVFFASGDQGVATADPLYSGGLCWNVTSNQFVSSSQGGHFAPNFPSTCPYVTSVGGTQVIPGAVVPPPSGTQPEEAAQYTPYGYSSGGGFSQIFPIPSYQNTTVQSWFKNHAPPYGADKYNNSMTARGYPDVSANGYAYVVAQGGQYQLIYGTSASTPTFASIITLINEARAAKGKSPVGFINPVAYANPQVFNDVTQGNNPGCHTAGFSAVKGWDPVTGLGTPNYPKMLDLWLSLP